MHVRAHTRVITIRNYTSTDFMHNILLLTACLAGRRCLLTSPRMTANTDGQLTSCSTNRWDCKHNDNNDKLYICS